MLKIHEVLTTHPALIDVELFVVASEETPYSKRTRGGPGPNKNHPDIVHTYVSADTAILNCPLTPMHYEPT